MRVKVGQRTRDIYEPCLLPSPLSLLFVYMNAPQKRADLARGQLFVSLFLASDFPWLIVILTHQDGQRTAATLRSQSSGTKKKLA